MENYQRYVVLNHLINEGYVSDVESAKIIFENMSQSWMTSILENRSLRDVVPGVLDYVRPRTTIRGLRDAQIRAEQELRRVIPLNRASYAGRRESGRVFGPNAQQNPDYTGPLPGGGSGTRDIMPGTTPSNVHTLPKPRPGTKYFSRSGRNNSTLRRLSDYI